MKAIKSSEEEILALQSKQRVIQSNLIRIGEDISYFKSMYQHYNSLKNDLEMGWISGDKVISLLDHKENEDFCS